MHALSTVASLVALVAVTRGSPCKPGHGDDYPGHDDDYPGHGDDYPGHGDYPDGGKVGKAIYFMTNEDTNAVVALSIGKDGKLSKGSVTETGGEGSVAVDAAGEPATPDALVGQSAITISGKVCSTPHTPILPICQPRTLTMPAQHIFAVNAGSNSLSMLSISDSDPTSLALVGDPVSVPGAFPNSVAVSAKHNVVCVSTTGESAGVSCGALSDDGLGLFDELRPIELGQTTPPAGPPNTVSQVLFSGDESALYAVVKGNPAGGTTGFISAYAVEDGSVSLEEVRSSPEGTDILFGTNVVPGTDNLVVADASFGAAVLSVDPSTHEASTLARTEIEGQNATCWAVYSERTGTAFLTDAFVSRLVEIDVADGSVLSTTEVPDSDVAGMTDLQAVGDFVYALASGDGSTEAAVLVADVSKSPEAGTQVQRFGLEGIAKNRAQGMAALK